ncbi:MAG: hypothetical protein ACREPX_04135 [Rhodanobacteraceae bacterium]
MTTIAYRAGILASDTQVTSTDGTKVHMRKIGRLPDGSHYGFAGNVKDINRVLRWIEEGTPKRKKPRPTEEIEAILIKPDGAIFVINDALEFEQILDKFFAIGSGGTYARAAMACGRSAVAAVKIAARFDANTSAPVETLTVIRAETAT